MRLVENIHRELALVDRGLNLELKLNKRVSFLWVDSASNLVEINSKTNTNIDMPTMFLHGPTFLWQINHLQSHCFATYYGGQFKEEESFKFANNHIVKAN